MMGYACSIMTSNLLGKRVFVVAFVFLVFIALVPACAAGGMEPEIPPNLDTYEGLRSAIDLGKDILIYDVRTPQEVESGRIPGAINVVHGEIADTLPRSYRDRVIVVYCQSGGRSHLAYEALVEKGFKYVFDFGSVNNWQGELSQE
jgi:rhodanese-related sulfurtransferase